MRGFVWGHDIKSAILIAGLLIGFSTEIAFAADASKAPEPAKPVDAASVFAGRWYEIGRTPKSFNKDCVAGTTNYQPKGWRHL
jgi:apolipoprotein D and lipocalin family protein